MKKLFTNLKVALTLLLLCGVCSAWGTDYTNKEISFTSSTLTTGWTTNGTFNSSYYKMTTGQYAKGTNQALFSSEILSSDMTIDVACGTFGTWSGEKKITVTAGFYDSNDVLLTSVSKTYTGLNSTQRTYRGEMILSKPTDPTKVAYLKLVLSDFQTGSVARLANVKLTYSTQAAGPIKTLKSIAVSGTPQKNTYEAGESFNPAGLIVTGTYDDDSQVPITSGITWNVNPSPLTVGTTSVSVTATVGGKTSPTFSVTGLTVNEHVVTPGTYEIRPNITFFGISTQTTGAHDPISGSQNDITVGHSGGSNFYCNLEQIRTYKNNTLTISVPDGYEITSIVLEVTDNAIFTASVGTYTSSLKTWEGKAKLVTLTSGQSSGNYQITKITVTYAEAKIPTSIEVTGTPAELWKGDAFNHEGITVTAHHSDADDEDVTASATFSGYDMSLSGNQTVTVEYFDLTDTYSITVKTIANTSATAYTTKEAIKLIDAGKDLASEVYVKGRISKIDKYENDKITYWLDDNAFQVYHGKGLENASFTSADNIEVGADVVVYGKIKKYSSTYEFDDGNYLASYSEPAKTNTTIYLGSYKTTLKLEDANDEYTVTYNGDGKLSITSSNENVAEAIIVGNKVLIEAIAVGTTIITVSAPETDNYFSATKSYTLTVVSPASLPLAYDGGKSNLPNGMFVTGLDNDYSSSPKLKFDDTDDNLVIWFGEQAGYISYDIKGNDFSGGTFEVMESANGYEYTVVAIYTGLSSVMNKANALKSDTRYVKFIYTEKKRGNVALGNICINKPVTITNAGWATAYVPFNATVSDNVTAYYVKVEDGALVKTEADVIPAGTGVLLKSNDGNTATATFTAATAAADEVKDNMLVGALTETTFSEEDTKYFILANGTNGVGFYFQGADNTTGSTVTCAAGKAVLAVPTAKTGAKAFFLFDDEPLGIKEINNAHKQDALYNLNGVRVNGNYNGIVIINGKKVIK